MHNYNCAFTDACASSTLVWLTIVQSISTQTNFSKTLTKSF